MSLEYGVSVSNKFAIPLGLSDDDEDPYEILKKTQETAEKNKESDKQAKKDGKGDKLSKSAKSKQNKKAQAVQLEQKGKPTDNTSAKKDENRPPRREQQSRQGGDRNVKFSRDTKETGGDDRREKKRGFDAVGEEKSTRGFANASTGFGSSERGERGFGSSDLNKSDRPDSGRGRGRGGFGGRGRGGRGGRGGSSGEFSRFGKREFDRHSGNDKTGVKPVDKREGSGAHNWGTVKDDVEAQLNDSNVSEENPEWSAQTEDVENQDPNEGEVADDEAAKEDENAPEMSLDEWKSLQAKTRSAAEFKIRKANEGADMKQWKNTYVLKKKVVSDSDEEETESEDEYEDRRHGKPTLNIEITFSDNPRRGRGGRRRGGGHRGGEGGGMGRGGGRGGEGMSRTSGDETSPRGRGRGGGEGRGGRGGEGRGKRKEAVPKVDDPEEFPAIMG